MRIARRGGIPISNYGSARLVGRRDRDQCGGILVGVFSLWFALGMIRLLGHAALRGPRRVTV